MKVLKLRKFYDVQGNDSSINIAFPAGHYHLFFDFSCGWKSGRSWEKKTQKETEANHLQISSGCV
jgi:hypothetical protein